jgi:predicted dithiol-disulfide oxidoreductase (DUF899 family)
MNRPKITNHDEWLVARKALLEKEKVFSRQRDELARARREMPMVKVEKEYAFDGPTGRVLLRDLFDGRPQLFLYHFMFDPSWEEGCKSCSFIADHFDGAVPHLRARDVSLVVVSRAPLAKIEPFKKRMGWRFPWLSSFGSDFNSDFGVTFGKESSASGYNYENRPFPMPEAPGLSTLLREGEDVFHVYSSYQRGVDILIGAYNIMDLMPFGRHEEGLSYGMAWLRHHDKYEGSP